MSVNLDLHIHYDSALNCFTGIHELTASHVVMIDTSGCNAALALVIAKNSILLLIGRNNRGDMFRRAVVLGFRPCLQLFKDK